MTDIIKTLDDTALLYDRAGIDGSLGADMCRDAIVEIERLKTAVEILAARNDGLVWVCPICDIAGCRHYREAMKGDGK